MMSKKILLKIFYIYWKIKTFSYYKLFGPYGVSNCIEIMPHLYIISFLRLYGAVVGDNCNIERGLILHRPDKHLPFKNLKIGDEVYIGHNTIIDLTSEVIINNYCAFGANCQIWTHTGDWTWNKDDENEKIEPVIIGKASIIYSGAIISQGTRIGDYARIGAGSIVMKDVKEKYFVAGIPAKEIKKRNF